MPTEAAEEPVDASSVLTCAEIGWSRLRSLLGRFGLTLETVGDGSAIPASYWGAPEAGIAGRTVWARGDTPLHSLFHEAGHVVCMDADRRAGFDTEAGGEDVEENAVCYLQVLLGDALEGVGRDRLMADMDAWGYSFRLGSTRAWFEDDAEDALAFLRQHGVVDADGQITFQLRA